MMLLCKPALLTPTLSHMLTCGWLCGLLEIHSYCNGSFPGWNLLFVDQPHRSGKWTNLWTKAVKRLNTKEGAEVDYGRVDILSVLQDIFTVVGRHRKASVQKEWQIKSNNKDSIVTCGEFGFGRIMNFVNKFKDDGDILAQYDPAHATISWAAVRVVLRSFR